MSRSIRRSIGLLAMLAITTSCGTRVSSQSRASAKGPTGTTASAALAPAGGELVAPTPGGTDPSAPAALSSSAITPSGGASSWAAPTGIAAGGGTGQGSKAGVSTAASAAGRRPAPPASTPPPGVGEAPSAPLGVPGTKSPIVIASVGTISGPLGSFFLPMTHAVQMWVRATNAKGGLNRHPIDLVVYDDGGDSARHISQVKEAVERRKAIAFVQNNEAVTGAGSVEYITAKRIPVIGSESASPWFYQSPMYFPQTSSGESLFVAALFGNAEMFVPQGKTKLGIVVCVEAQPCVDAGKWWQERARDAGFTSAELIKTSITQPDYTAECLRLRNNGVQVVLPALDTTGVERLAASCVRQGYKPAFGLFSAEMHDRFKDNPNLEGFGGPITTFAYFQSGTPATDEFQQVMKQFGSNVVRSFGLGLGWTSAKLFEKAAVNIGEPPTPEAVLQGLWAVKNDTLGGLTMPLTFTEGQNATPQACWFLVTVKNKTWISPNNHALHCAK